MDEIKNTIIANWKMHGSHDFVKNWVSALSIASPSEKNIVVCPPFPYISLLKSLLDDAILVGGQDISAVAEDGARTGEISARMLFDTGCRYTLIGHSEKRYYAGDTDECCATKYQVAVNHDLNAVICVGELLPIRQKGQAIEFVLEQLRTILKVISTEAPAQLHIAYEPRWAIGTGLTPSLDEIDEIHTAIREELIRQIGTFGDTIPLLYGGSVKSSNSKMILDLPNVNGLLVGGASLSPLEFNKICNLE